MKYHRLLGGLLALWMASIPFVTALAHADEPRLEIGVERINPGGTLEIRGVDFAPEGPVTLVLTSQETKISLGIIAADVEGGFSLLYVLPAWLGEGTYTVEASSGEHQIAGPPFMVSGVAVAEEEEESQRGQEDALLAPMPTFAAPTVAAPTGGTPASPISTRARSSVALALVAVAAAGAALAAGISVRKRPR